MEIEELRKHIVMTSCKEVKNICQPLLSLDINIFIYVRLFPSGKRIIFCSNYDWNEFYLTNFYKLAYPIYVPFEAKAEGIIFVDKDQYPQLETFNEAATFFNYKNGICLASTCKSFKEIVYFGSYNCNKIINDHFLRNVPILRKFISYFKNSASDLFNKYNGHHLITPKEYHFEFHQSDSHVALYKDLVRNLEQKLKMNRYYLITEEGETFLTSREMDILKWLTMSKSADEIGTILNISKRTVETHIINTKVKLNCTKYSQLIHKVTQLELFS